MSTANILKGLKFAGGLALKAAPMLGPAAVPLGIASTIAGGVVGGALKDKKNAALQAALKAETGPGREAAAVAEAANRANIGNQALAPHIIAQGPQAGRSGGRTFAPYSGQKAAENRELVQKTIDKAGAKTKEATAQSMKDSGDRQFALRAAIEENKAAQRTATDEQLFGERNKKTGARMGGGGLVGAIGGKGGALEKVVADWKAKNDPFGGTMAEVAEEATGGAPAEAATYKVREGDTLGEIATKNKTTIEALQAANPDLIKNPNLIEEGWQLKIPGTEAPAAAAASGSAQAAAAPTQEAPARPNMYRDVRDQFRERKEAREEERRVEGILEEDAATEAEIGAENAPPTLDVANLYRQRLRQQYGSLPQETQVYLDRTLHPESWVERSPEDQKAMINIMTTIFETQGFNTDVRIGD